MWSRFQQTLGKCLPMVSIVLSPVFPITTINNDNTNNGSRTGLVLSRFQQHPQQAQLQQAQVQQQQVQLQQLQQLQQHHDLYQNHQYYQMFNNMNNNMNNGNNMNNTSLPTPSTHPSTSLPTPSVPISSLTSSLTPALRTTFAPPIPLPPIFQLPVPSQPQNNQQILNQLINNIEQQDTKLVRDLQKLNAKQSKIKRNGWILNKFLYGFLCKKVSLTKQQIAAIKENNTMNLIPKIYFTQDKVLASFIATVSQEYKQTNKKYKSFIRALNSTLSDTCNEYEISKDFQSSNLYNARSVMRGIQSTDEYKKEKPTQARSCTKNEYNDAMNINLIKCDGTIDLWLLSEKAGFCMTSGFCIRGAELHNGNDEDLVIGVDEDGYQMMDLTIYHDKTRSTSFHKVVYCAEDGAHDPLNYNNNACSVAVVAKYMEEKAVGLDYIRSTGSTSAGVNKILAKPGIGALIRRVRDKGKSNGGGQYISAQRRGAKQLDFIQHIAVKLGWKFDKRIGQNDIFSIHSGKKSGIVACARDADDVLDDSDKKAISGHVTVAMYDYYANNGQYKARSAAKKLAIVKKKKRRKLNNGMNDENVPPVIYDGFSMSSSYYLGGDNGDNGIKQEK